LPRLILSVLYCCPAYSSIEWANPGAPPTRIGPLGKYNHHPTPSHTHSSPPFSKTKSAEANPVRFRCLACDSFLPSDPRGNPSAIYICGQESIPRRENCRTRRTAEQHSPSAGIWKITVRFYIMKLVRVSWTNLWRSEQFWGGKKVRTPLFRQQIKSLRVFFLLAHVTLRGSWPPRVNAQTAPW